MISFADKGIIFFISGEKEVRAARDAILKCIQSSHKFLNEIHFMKKQYSKSANVMPIFALIVYPK